MNCPHCFQHVPPESAFCPYCGARLGEVNPNASPEAAEDPTYGPLAQANLFRLRGDWAAAREKTVDVLREYPNSGTAHSLMGDIFADQELYEDAAQWYRMALDLEPGNAADERKLATAEARMGENQAAGPVTDGASPAVSGFRVAAWAAAAFLILVIALGIWISRLTPRPEPAPAPAAPRVGTVPGGAVAPPPATGAGPPAPEPNGNPSALPGSPTQPEGAAPAPAAQADSGLSSGESREEAGMRAQLAALAPTLAATGLRLAHLQIDPRSQTAAITLDGSGVNGAEPGWMDSVYGAALVVAARAMRADKALGHARVRVVMPLATSQGVMREVAFIGDISRPAGFDSTPNGAPVSFDRRWWHAGLTPPPGIASTP
jgi:hypothetical protein